MKHSRIPKWAIIAVVAVVVYLGMKKGLIPNPLAKKAA